MTPWHYKTKSRYKGKGEFGVSGIMKIGFIAQRSLPIHASSIDERPLGGTETGLIRVAEELSRRGHVVSVGTTHKDPHQSVPVYCTIREFMRAGPYDALICVQDWSPLFSGLEAGVKLYWTGDSYDQFMNFGVGDKRVYDRIDRLLTVSNWQSEELCRRSGFPGEKVRVIRNGIHPPYFEGDEDRNPFRLIYSSAPYRGLALAPEIYLQLKKRYPNLELHVFSGLGIYDRETPYQGVEATEWERLKHVLTELPDVFVHGNVTQSALAREFMKSGILLYPNTFLETSCISVIEAMAGGCIPVTSALGALPETVGDCGVLVSGVPGTKDYSSNFVHEVSRILSDNSYARSLSTKAKERVRSEFHWEDVTDRLERVLEE